MSDKLSDCPFCGSAGKYIQGYATLDDCHFIDCEGCGISSKVFDSKDAAIAAWNRRASTAPAIPAEPDDEAISAVRARLEQHAVYFSRSSIEEIVSAVRKAAPAISESDLLALLPGTTYMDAPDGGSPSLLEQLQRMAKDAARYRRLRDKHDGDGPAAAVRCLTGPFFNAAIHGERLDAAIDGARAGEKS